MAISKQNQFSSMSDDEEDLELLRKAALQTLKNSICKADIPSQIQPALNTYTKNKYSMSPKRGRGFYNSGPIRGGHRNGHINRNTNLISIPTMEPHEKVQPMTGGKLVLPQDRYCTKPGTVDLKKEESKFSRYVDHSEDSDSDNSDIVLSESNCELKKANSLDALMEELEYEISGEKPTTNTKCKVKKPEQYVCVTSTSENEKKQPTDSSKEDGDNECIALHTSSIADSPSVLSQNNSEHLNNDKNATKVKTSTKNNEVLVDHEVNVSKFNSERRTTSNSPRKALLPKPTYNSHQHGSSYVNRVPVIPENPGFQPRYRPGNHYTNEVPFLPHNLSHSSKMRLLPSDLYNHPPVNIPRPLSPLNLNTDALCNIAMAPLSPRSAAFVLQNREIVEKRKRSPRQSYSRSPSPASRQRSNSRSPRRVQSPSRRRYPYSASPNRLSPPRRAARSRRSPSPAGCGDRGFKKDGLMTNNRRPKCPEDIKRERTQSPDMPRKRNLSPSLHKKRSNPSPELPRKRNSPDISYKRNDSPNLSRQRSKSPTVLTKRSISPVMPTKRSLSPIVSVKRSISPIIPSKRSSSPNSYTNRKRSHSPSVNVKTSEDKRTLGIEEVDPVLEARRKKFEQHGAISNRVIRLKNNAQEDSETNSEDVEKPTCELVSSDVEDDTLELDTLDTTIDDIFSDEESDDENEGRFKSTTNDKISGSVLRFSQVVNGPNRSIKNKSLEDTCRERNRDRRDVRGHRERDRNARGGREADRGYRNTQNDRKERVERKEEIRREDVDANRWARDSERKEDNRSERKDDNRSERKEDRSERRDERVERRDERVERRDDRIERRDERNNDRKESRVQRSDNRSESRKHNRSDRKEERKPSVKTRLTLKKEEDVKEIPVVTKVEEVVTQNPKDFDDIEWFINEPKQSKIKEKPVIARKVAIATVEKDASEYQPEAVVLTVIDNDEQDVMRKNEAGDLRAQLSRKRAERQCHKPVVNTEDVQSRLLHNALGAVFQKSKKTKRPELEAAPKEKLSIHQRLGLSDDHSDRKKKKKSKRSTEQV